MKNCIFGLAILFIVLSTKSADAYYWNQSVESVEKVSATQVLEAGPSVYVRLENGKTVSSGGYLSPPGTWRRLMAHNPLVTVSPCSQTPGPRYEIWEERVEFPNCKIYWFRKHYRFTSHRIGAWINSGGGPKPYYLVYHKVVLGGSDNWGRFYGTFRLIYHSGADCIRDGEINALDLALVARYEDPSEPDKFVGRGHPADVNGDTRVDRDDMEIVANLLGAVPDMEATEAIPYINDVAPAPPLASYNKVLAWGKIRTR